MSSPSRREFLKTTGLGLVGLPELEFTSVSAGDARLGSSPIVPQSRALDVPGVHAYPSEHSVAAGGTLELRVSASVPYRLSICRLGRGIDDPKTDQVLSQLGEFPARPLPIRPGSFVRIARPLPKPREGLTLECWVRPWSVRDFAGLITRHAYPAACGWGLFLRPGGNPAFYLGDGERYQAQFDSASPEPTVAVGRWSHLAGTWNGREKALWIDGRRVGCWDFDGVLGNAVIPLLLGAYLEGDDATHFLDGDLALPVIYNRALTEGEITRRFEDKGLTVPQGNHVLACWPLNEERGDRVADASGHGCDGEIVNHATWMIGGPSFDPNVPRFGDYDPRADLRRGHALRFASDDLYDCGWDIVHRWRVPDDAKAGLHVARFEYLDDEVRRWMHCTFVFRRGPTRPKAPILVLAATNTWRAYSGTPFVIAPPATDLKQVWGTGGIGKDATRPSFNLYRNHAAGQGTYQVGLRMPWPAAGPYVLYGGPTGYSHLMRAERFLHVWLEEQGYRFDVISDLDLHRDPETLRDYQIVMINGHNEYWSLPMLRGLDDYLKRDGHVIVLSGNSLFWRVSFDDDGTIMESRKVDAPGFQVPTSRRGEAWHSHDGLRGGMLRECGLPGWRLIGLDSLGWNNQGNPENFGPYVAEAVDHPFFRMPEDAGLKSGDRFGWAGEPGRMPMANGHEFDVRPSTLAALQEQPDPEGSSVPADPPGMIRLANGIIPWSQGGSAFDYFFRPIKPTTDQGGEMIVWDRPEGGHVFNAGSIGSGWALHADPRWAALLRNVLHHFGVPRSTRPG
jgi:hypothetical protein